MSRISRTTSHTAVVLCICATLAAATACRDNLSSVVDKAVGTAEAAASTELQLTRKLDPYAQCLEEHSSGIRESRRHYLSWLDDPSKGPSCRKRRYSIYRLAPVNDCLREMEQAQKSTPALPALELVGSRFAANLSGLAALLKQAHDYYEGSGYERDKCAMGRTLHQRLMKTWSDLQRAESELRDLIDTHDAKLLEQELQRTLTLYGKGLRFYHKRIQVEARRVLRVVRQHASSRSASLEALSTAVAEFGATVQALQHVAQRMPEETKAALFWDSYVAQTNEFMNAVKEFSRRRMEGRSYTDGEEKRLASGVAHWVVGSAAKVEKEHEELARIASGLEFRH